MSAVYEDGGTGSVCKVILMGRLGRDPEVKTFHSGQSVCEFTLATNDRRKDSAGQWQETTEWHRVRVWGKQGENVAKHLTKGRSVHIEGTIKTDKWQDNNGFQREMMYIVARRVTFVGDRQQQRQQNPYQGQGQQQPNPYDARTARRGPGNDELGGF